MDGCTAWREVGGRDGNKALADGQMVDRMISGRALVECALRVGVEYLADGGIKGGGAWAGGLHSPSSARQLELQSPLSYAGRIPCLICLVRPSLTLDDAARPAVHSFHERLIWTASPHSLARLSS